MNGLTRTSPGLGTEDSAEDKAAITIIRAPAAPRRSQRTHTHAAQAETEGDREVEVESEQTSESSSGSDMDGGARE